MKILHIISTSKWTGSATYAVDIVEYLQNKSVDTLLIIRTIPSGNLKEILKIKKINYSEKLKLYKKFNPIYFCLDFFNLKKIIKDFSPNIIHVHYSLENILSILTINKKINLIRSIHNTKSSLKKPFSKFILNKNNFIHTVCSEYKNNLIKYNNIPQYKIKIISGWVDTNKFNPNGEKFLKDDNYIKIGMVARFQKHRGHEYLVKAFKKISDTNKVKLILTGRGEYKSNIEKLVKELKLEDKVIFTGYLKEKLPDLLRSLDIFVLLEEGTDGTCRAILEAMATGLPIVSVKKGAIIDTVVNNKNGYLIDSKNNIEQLAEKLNILVKNKDLRKNFGEKSRKIVLEKFNKEKKLEEFFNFYKEIAGSN